MADSQPAHSPVALDMIPHVSSNALPTTPLSRDSEKIVRYEMDAEASDVWCQRLVEGESIGKDDALAILRLYHALELKNVRLAYEKDKEIESLRTEVQIATGKIAQSDMMAALSTDIDRNRKQIESLQAALKSTVLDIDSLRSSISVHNAALATRKSR